MAGSATGPLLAEAPCMRRHGSIFAMLLVAACGGGEPSAGEPDARPDPGGDGGGGEEPIGELVVLSGGGFGHLWFPPVVFGSIWGDAPPGWHTEVARVGACRVLA